MYCANCGFRNSDDARYCENCGAPMVADDGIKAKPGGSKNNLMIIIIIAAGAVLLTAGAVFGLMHLFHSDRAVEDGGYYAGEDYDYDSGDYGSYESDEDYSYDEDYDYSGQDDDIISYSSSQYLTEEDIWGMTADELYLAVNEIYARHGAIFESPEYTNYFNSKDWYYPSRTQKEARADFNDFEIKNADFMSKRAHELEGTD